MIRPYNKLDKPILLNLLRMNIPEYFAPSEEQDFIEYLDHKLEKYFIFEEDGQIIGCGGLNFLQEGREARISWDMIHPDHQGKGIGKALTQHRIHIAQQDPLVGKIIVRTSQLAFQFYEKQGFQLQEVVKDYWAQGFDLYLMEMNG